LNIKTRFNALDIDVKVLIALNMCVYIIVILVMKLEFDMIMIFWGITILYTAVFPLFNNKQTIGMKLNKLKVVRNTGSEISNLLFSLRALISLVLGPLFLIIFITKDQNTLPDLMFRTKIIKEQDE